MDSRPRDLSLEMEQRIVDAYRKMTNRERTQKMLDLNRAITLTQIAAIRKAHPEADEHEIRMRVASRWVRNPELLKAAFGWDVSEMGY
jgi:DNA-binding transcriptional regulator YiaG